MMRRPILRSLSVLALSLVLAPGAVATEVDFQVTEVPEVTDLGAPKPLDRAALKQVKGLGMADLEKYATAARFEKFEVAPREKADCWRRLAKEAPSLAAMAEKRAGEWDACATKVEEEFKKRKAAAMASDWKRLFPLLRDGGTPGPARNDFAARFLRAYAETPGVTHGTLMDIRPLLPAGSLKDIVGKYEREGRMFLPIEMNHFVFQSVGLGAGSRIGIDPLRKLHASRDKAWQESGKGKAVQRAIQAVDELHWISGLVEDDKGKTMGLVQSKTGDPVYVPAKRYSDFTSLQSAISGELSSDVANWMMYDPKSPISAPYKAALEAIRGEEVPRP